jgi:hypothetical protein
MKHISVRLSDKHAGLIDSTGKSYAAVIREALDQFFGIGEAYEIRTMVEEMLMEHVRVFHGGGLVVQWEHNENSESAGTVLHEEHNKNTNRVLQKEHNENPKKPIYVPMLNGKSMPVKRVLEYIRSEILAGRELTPSKVADNLDLNLHNMKNILPKYGVHTKRTAQNRLYTKKESLPAIETALASL